MTKEKSPQKWQKVQQIIEDECKKEDENWIKRRRVLDTKLILLIILKISTNERSRGLRNVLDDFWNKCEAARIKLESEKAIAASSIEGTALLMFDRGYFSYCLLHQCVKKGVDALFRLHIAGVNKEIEKFINSSETDQMIEYIPSTTVLHDLKKQVFFAKRRDIY